MVGLDDREKKHGVGVFSEEMDAANGLVNGIKTQSGAVDTRAQFSWLPPGYRGL